MRSGSSCKEGRPTNTKRSASEKERPSKVRRVSSKTVKGPSKEKRSKKKKRNFLREGKTHHDEQECH
jgi:hypothetical protein